MVSSDASPKKGEEITKARRKRRLRAFFCIEGRRLCHADILRACEHLVGLVHRIHVGTLLGLGHELG